MKKFALSENYEIVKPPKIGGLGVEKKEKISFLLTTITIITIVL